MDLATFSCVASADCPLNSVANSAQKTCMCDTGFYFTTDYAECVEESSCGAHTVTSSGRCVCATGKLLSLDTSSCGSSCGTHQHNSSNNCVCDTGYTMTMDRSACITTCDVG